VKAIKDCTGALTYFPGDQGYATAGPPENLSELSCSPSDIVKLIGRKEICEKARDFIKTNLCAWQNAHSIPFDVIPAIHLDWFEAKRVFEQLMSQYQATKRLSRTHKITPWESPSESHSDTPSPDAWQSFVRKFRYNDENTPGATVMLIVEFEDPARRPEITELVQKAMKDARDASRIATAVLKENMWSQAPSSTDVRKIAETSGSAIREVGTGKYEIMGSRRSISKALDGLETLILSHSRITPADKQRVSSV